MGFYSSALHFWGYRYVPSHPLGKQVGISHLFYSFIEKKYYFSSN